MSDLNMPNMYMPNMSKSLENNKNNNKNSSKNNNEQRRADSHIINEHIFLIFSLIMLAAFSRLLPHPENVTPIAAMALLAGARITNYALAYFIPLAAMIVSDLIIGFHSTMIFVYAGMIITVALGRLLSDKINILSAASASLAASILFFTISNFGVWLTGGIYPLNSSGLIACFIAAIPFFANSVFGDLFFTALLFGGFSFARRRMVRVYSI